VYDYLEGQLAERQPTRLVLDVGGVGYELITPLGSSFGPGPRLRAYVHLHVREDAHLLYGFPDRGARELFRLLLKVKQVGPAMANGILSGMAPADLLATIQAKDMRRLTSIKGVGKKTAEQILLDLGDRLGEFPNLTGGVRPPVVAKSAQLSESERQTIQALVSIGFTEKEAEAATASAVAAVGHGDLERLLRTALKR
jgi:holliday junction DNA helicase RuvA